MSHVWINNDWVPVATALGDAERRGYERAIEVLRDEDRYREWVRAAGRGAVLDGRPLPPLLGHVRAIADYLEAAVASSLVKGDSDPKIIKCEHPVVCETTGLCGHCGNAVAPPARRAPDLMANLRASLDRAKAQRGDSEQ